MKKLLCILSLGASLMPLKAMDEASPAERVPFSPAATALGGEAPQTAYTEDRRKLMEAQIVARRIILRGMENGQLLSVPKKEFNLLVKAVAQELLKTHTDDRDHTLIQFDVLRTLERYRRSYDAPRGQKRTFDDSGTTNTDAAVVPE